MEASKFQEILRELSMCKQCVPDCLFLCPRMKAWEHGTNTMGMIGACLSKYLNSYKAVTFSTLCQHTLDWLVLGYKYVLHGQIYGWMHRVLWPTCGYVCVLRDERTRTPMLAQLVLWSMCTPFSFSGKVCWLEIQCVSALMSSHIVSCTVCWGLDLEVCVRTIVVKIEHYSGAYFDCLALKALYTYSA